MQKKLLVLLIAMLAFSPLAFSASAISAESTTQYIGPVVTEITLTGEGSAIEWEADGYSVNGFKVVWSKNQNPTYPTRSGDAYHYFSDPDKTSDTLTAFSGDGNYYVRVCEYLGGACGVYSNQIAVTMGNSSVDCNAVYEPVCGLIQPLCIAAPCPALEETYRNMCSLRTSGAVYLHDGRCDVDNEVISITLKADGPKLHWVVNGYSANGFKVTWSKNENPTYPTRLGDKYHYFFDPSKSSDILTAFDGEGTYYARVCEYLAGDCGAYSNQVAVKLGEVKVCTMEYAPICGVNGKTYSNKCMADVVGVAKAYYGECKKDDEIVAIENSAELLSENKLDDILIELQELRSLVREQQTQIKYLQDLMSDVSQVTTKMQNSINSFITYGVDDNTKRLGEGERAAVMHSYKAAYGKLPSTESELSDAIKIANGRFPTMISEEAEAAAKQRFEYIYKRVADMEESKDKAAITVMTYGLRQRAENRNLDSERNGIKIFKDIYGTNPETTEEWNTMQAITYSGATR